MNIKVTGYKEQTLFNFDMIVNNNNDFEKVIKVLRIFYDNSQENTGEKPVTGQAGLRQTLSKDSLDNNDLLNASQIMDNASEIAKLINKEYPKSETNLKDGGITP